MTTAPCVFALQPEYGERIAAELGVSLASHEERTFEDGEHKIRPLESVRDRDVYVVSSLYGDASLSVNDRLLQLLLLLGALRDAGAARLTAILPYLCYARKDRRTKARDPVSTRYIATMLEAVGIDRVLTMDVHNTAAYENAFRIPTERLGAASLLAERLVHSLGDTNPVVVSPDVGGIKRADPFRRLLEASMGQPLDHGFMEKTRSQGELSGERLTGNVQGREVVLVDDLVSSGRTLARAANACKQHGAHNVVAVATHGVFSTETEALLSDCALEKLLVTDTIPLPRPGFSINWPGLEQITTAPLMAEAIHRLHHGESLVALDQVSWD